MHSNCRNMPAYVGILILFISVFEIHLSIATDASIRMTRQTATKDVPSNTLTTETFEDWQKWKQKHSGCNPMKNPYQSPIQIDSGKAKHDNEKHPLYIHSGQPLGNCYFLSILDSGESFEMETVSILVSPICYEHVTYISGAGESPTNYRYFKKAHIFFEIETDSQQERSLHVFDEKLFQMEIAMEFADEDLNITEVHLMVEVASADILQSNPAFQPIEMTIPNLNQEIFNEALGTSTRHKRRTLLRNKCTEYEQVYFDAIKKQETDLGNTTYVNHIVSLKKMVDAVSGISSESMLTLKEKIQELKENGKKKLDESRDFGERLAEIETEQLELAEIGNQPDDPEYSEHFDKLNDLANEYQNISDANEELFETANAMQTRAETLQAQLDQMKAQLKANQIGVLGESIEAGVVYDSPESLLKAYSEAVNNSQALIKAKQQFNSSCREADEYIKNPYGFVPITHIFQLSWLFPESGGYYWYKGSNPIPPCERRRHSIVLKKPVKINTDQFATFKSILSLRALRESIDTVKNAGEVSKLDNSFRVGNMKPIIRKANNSQVRFISRSLVYEQDDGFHMKTSHSNSSRRRSLSLIGESSSGQDFKLKPSSSKFLPTMLVAKAFTRILS